MIRTSFKIAKLNFSNIWKILLYKIVALLVISLLAYTIILPIVTDLLATEFFVNVQNGLLNLIYRFDYVAAGQYFTTAWQIGVDVFNQTLPYNTFLVSLTVFVVIIMGNIILNFADLATVNVINKKMSQKQKVGFMSSLNATYKQNLFVQFIKTIISLPISVLIFVAIYFLCSFSVSIGLNIYIAFVLYTLLAIFIFTLKSAMFNSFYSAIVEDNLNVFAAIKLSFKNFNILGAKGYVSTMLLYLIITVANLLFAYITFGISLVFTLPISTLCLLVYFNVYYYKATNKKYYMEDIIQINKTN